MAGANRTDDANDPHDLRRFLLAQDDACLTALAELRSGRKRSHCMWFVFPQFAGLGSSATSRHFAIRSADEARAYLAHPVLGAQLTHQRGQGTPSQRLPDAEFLLAQGCCIGPLGRVFEQ